MEHTKYIYDNIAHQFDKTRHRIWPCVINFLNLFTDNMELLDIGCGNGKNILSKPNLKFKGIDFSPQMCNICIKKGLDVLESNMTSLPFYDNFFDGFMAVASYHHLDNDIDRQKTLNEMYRILKPSGKGLITVWAMEQPSDSKFIFNKSDEKVSWLDEKTSTIYYRYYHIYKENELINEIIKLKPEFKINSFGWEKGNWWIIIEK